MKFLVAVSVFLVICASSTFAYVDGEDSDKHHAVWGIQGIHDKLIRRDVLISDAVIYGKAKDTYTFPSSEHTPLTEYSTITAVRALDQYNEGHGGTVKLLAGGPNSRDVTLKVKSQVFRGYHFIIEIYGH